MTKKTKGTPSEIDVFVGGRLREIRVAKGISQEKLGDAVDITFQQIQKYENGKNRISAGRLYQFATLFDVSTNEFFPLRMDHVKGSALTKEQVDVLRICKDVSEDEMKHLRAFIRALKYKEKV